MNAAKILDIFTFALCVLVWIGIVTFLRRRKKKDLVYLLFFSVFFVYIVIVLDYTVFQFQSLILLKYLEPKLILNGQAAGKAMNLIPLVTLTLADLKTSLLNVLLMIPFGLGLPFIARLRARGVILIGALFSLFIEVLQLSSGLVAGITFRIADINDVIFNTVGVAFGYVLFLGVMYLFRRVSQNLKGVSNPIVRYLSNVQKKDEP